MEIISVQKNGITVEVCPQRWGMITSVCFWEKEILYQDMLKETLYDTSKSVRWWIPYLFPNAGPLEVIKQSWKWWKLPQHGFARNVKWGIEKQKEYQLIFKIVSSHVSKKIYPYDFEILQKIEIIDEYVVLSHEIKNTGDKNMPISTGLHPYFGVPNGDKSQIDFLFSQWGDVKDQLEKWSNDQMVSFDIEGKTIWFVIPEIWEVQLEVSDDYKKIWIWSLRDKNFVCIEPVMNDYGGLIDSPIIIQPWEVNTNFMKIKLKK